MFSSLDSESEDKLKKPLYIENIINQHCDRVLPKNFLSKDVKNSKTAFITNNKKDNEDGKKFALSLFNMKAKKDIFDIIRSHTTLYHKSKGYTKKEGGKKVHTTHIKLVGKPPKAIVFLFHGLGSLFDFEGGFSSYFAERNFEVIGFDQPQFGRSVPKEKLTKHGPPGLITNFNDLYINGFVFIEQFFKNNEDYKDVPFFLWGESLGGSTVSAMGIHMKKRWKKRKDLMDNFKGIIACCPSYETQLKPNWMMFQILKLICKVNPHFRFIGKQIIASRIVETQKKFGDSPWTVKGIKLLTGMHALLLSEYCVENVKEFEAPVIFFVAEFDNMVKSSAIAKYFENVSSKDKKMIVFEKCLHALTAEYSAKKQANFTIEWMLERCKKNSKEKKNDEIVS